MRKALFWDRDGTLIVHRPYLHDAAEVELMPGVRDVLKRAVADGFLLFLHTNQSGVGRGYFTMSEVAACNDRMCELLELPQPGFTTVCVAPERPDEPSDYRKPSPRFILEMLATHDLDPRNSWMIGDAISDVQTGLNAGIRAAMVHSLLPSDFPSVAWHCANVSTFYARLATGSESHDAEQ